MTVFLKTKLLSPSLLRVGPGPAWCRCFIRLSLTTTPTLSSFLSHVTHHIVVSRAVIYRSLVTALMFAFAFLVYSHLLDTPMDFFYIVEGTGIRKITLLVVPFLFMPKKGVGKQT